MGSVDHHGTIKTAVNAIVTRFFSPMIKVNGKDRFQENLVGGPNNRLEKSLVRIGSGTPGNLNDKRSTLGIVVEIFVFDGLAEISPEKSDGLLQVIDIIRANGVLAVSLLKKVFGGNDHSRTPLFKDEKAKTERLTNSTMSSANGKDRGTTKEPGDTRKIDGCLKWHFSNNHSIVRHKRWSR